MKIVDCTNVFLILLYPCHFPMHDCYGTLALQCDHLASRASPVTVASGANAMAPYVNLVSKESRRFAMKETQMPSLKSTRRTALMQKITSPLLRLLPWKDDALEVVTENEVIGENLKIMQFRLDCTPL